MTTLTEILDLALNRLHLGETPDAILASYPEYADELRGLLTVAARVTSLPPVVLPSAGAMQSDRNAFLLEVALLQVEPVSSGPLVRLKEWMVHLQSRRVPNPFQRKERWKMSTIAVTLTLLIALLVGTVGGVTAMTGDILPGAAAYPVKLLIEESTLFFTPDPAQRAVQHMLLAEERSEEIQQLVARGEAPDTGALTRLQHQLNLSVWYANQLEDDAREALLLRIREMVNEQQQAMVKLQDESQEPVRTALRETNRILERAGEEIDAQLGDPQLNRGRNGQGSQPEAPVEPSITPPRAQHGIGSQNTVTPEETCDGCEPVGDEHQYGPSSETQPGPGAPGGNADGDCDDCTPVGDEHKYGPSSETQPGPGAPGGNADGDCGGCTPVGDEHKYGQQTDPAPTAPVETESAESVTPEPCSDCTPAGDANQHGQTAAEDSPGEPGGSEDAPCDGCTTDGAGNRNENRDQTSPGGNGEGGRP